MPTGARGVSHRKARHACSFRAPFYGRETSVPQEWSCAMTLIKRVWLPFLVVFAIAIGLVAVSNLRSVFGSDGAIVTPIDADTAENFNPKIVKYEIFGTGSYASINYADLDGKPQRTGEVTLPWTLTLET